MHEAMRLDPTEEGTTVPRRARAARWGKTALWAVLISIVTGLLLPAPVWGQQGGIRRLGALPHPKLGNAVGGVPGIVAVDSAARRMYAAAPTNTGGQVIVEYDLTRRIPTVRREAPIEWLYSPHRTRVGLDTAGGRLFFIDAPTDFDQGGDSCPHSLCSYLRVFNLRTFRVEATYELSSLIPNFFAQGLTYSADDGLLYLIGSSTGTLTRLVETLPAVPFWPLTIAAFDPDGGRPVWWKVIPQCQRPVSGTSSGAVIARSPYQNALYVACVRPDPIDVTINGPGQSGLVRVWFTPRADLAGAAAFPVEFFPISGAYTTGEGIKGKAHYDPVADRFYLTSTATLTPGAWVFDGRESAWVGFIPAIRAELAGIGVDPGSGHVYMRSGSIPPSLIVADGRSTPVSQGSVYPFAPDPAYIETDPLTRRVFVPSTERTGRRQVLVLLDETEKAPLAAQTDYDGLTTDVPEGPNTEATYSGSLNGYGSRFVLVGGTGGITTSPGYTLSNEQIPDSGLGLPGPTVWDHGVVLGLPPGDRGTILGHVGSVDVRNSGAAASAQAVTPDSQTANDYINKQHEVLTQLGQDEDSAQPWPWPVAVCLDGEGKPSAPDESGAGTVAKASCDLKKEEATASSSAGDVVLAEGMSIGSSSFRGSAVRTPGEGIVTTATSVARDIRISVPGAGALTIGRITAIARTSARGRPGTSGVQWARDIDHVAIHDSSGKPIFSCATSCDTRAVEDAVREWAGIKIAIKFPTPRTRKTPGGAFAEIQKTSGAYYDGFVVNNDETFSSPAAEILVYNDYGERSRLLIQLAAIQASSIYGISVNAADSGPAPELPPLPPPVGEIIPPGLPVAPPPAAPPPARGGSILERLVETSRFLIRSPGDALLISLIASLSLGAAVTFWRRRNLLGLLDDFGLATGAGRRAPDTH